MKIIDERQAQIEFYETFLPRINPTLKIEDIITDSNDGVLYGNLLEFKKNVKNLNEHLFQCIKYLSARRVKGKPIPSNIIIIDLTQQTAWQYLSEPFINDIEKLYNGGASKNNSGFVGGEPNAKFEYGKNQVDAEKMVHVLKTDKYTKIHIDENCIVGWATEFYNRYPKARKEDFLGDDTGKHRTIGEIRQPKLFKDYIFAYKGKSNVRFNYLMDKLNDFLMKKNLGAFYTPSQYVDLSIDLVRKAIKRVPKGNDYIILDRCAGTGNLEARLSEEELSHCIVSTYEYYEYKVLQELLGSKVRHIIPPFEDEKTFQMGLVAGCDALSKEFVENKIIKQYLDNQKCSIILYENPPYTETTSFEHQKRGKGAISSTWKQGYVVEEMSKDKLGQAINDMGNVFIWSGFKFYLRQPTDSYVVYSPIKYWKAQHIVNKNFIEGYAFNRRHFHTNTDACIMCALWANEDKEIEKLKCKAFDIKNNTLVDCGTVEFKKIYEKFSEKYYDKRTFDDATYDGITTDLSGYETPQGKGVRIKPLYSENMLGYLVADSIGFDNPDAKSSLLVAGRYNGNGFFLHKDSFIDRLPLFASSRYIHYEKSFLVRGAIMKSGDGYKKWYKDLNGDKLNEWLLKCLLFCTLEMQNHMKTFVGSDGRQYRNELCLDTTNGETVSSKYLKKMKLTKEEQELIGVWKQVLKYAKKTEEYNKNCTYGTHQIFSELDIVVQDENGENQYKYKELHSSLELLKQKLKPYYMKEIVPVLYKYEFLK